MSTTYGSQYFLRPLTGSRAFVRVIDAQRHFLNVFNYCYGTMMVPYHHYQADVSLCNTGKWRSEAGIHLFIDYRNKL